MFPVSLPAGPVAQIVLIVFLISPRKILRQYRRAVVFTLGKFQAVNGPPLVPPVLAPQFVQLALRLPVISTYDVTTPLRA